VHRPRQADLFFRGKIGAQPAERFVCDRVHALAEGRAQVALPEVDLLECSRLHAGRDEPSEAGFLPVDRMDLRHDGDAAFDHVAPLLGRCIEEEAGLGVHGFENRDVSPGEAHDEEGGAQDA
jgi:hypothetical protein